MSGLFPLFGAGVGMALGYVAWRIAQRFIGRDAPGVRLPSGAIPALVMAAWGAYVFGRTDDPNVILAALASTALLAIIVLVDLAVYRIPNELVGALLAWGVVQMVWLSGGSWHGALLGALIGGGLFLMAAWVGRGALGGGDVKFAAAEGALLGFPLILSGLWLGIVFGGLAAAWLLATRRAGRKDAFAYGPYLALGGWIIYLMTLHLLPWQS